MYIFWNNMMNWWTWLKSTMENHPGKQRNHKDYMPPVLAKQLDFSSLLVAYRKAQGGAWVQEGYSAYQRGLVRLRGTLALGGGCTCPVAETSAGYYWLESLCKGLVASLCNHTSEVWYCAWSTNAWLGLKFFGTFTRLVVKVCNLCRVKTDISVVLTVKSSSDPHMST